ncbi:MAG TPA: response regulator [Bacteroidetes bacterium]|nr:response regulator [Bacteroidota bacterium]
MNVLAKKINEAAKTHPIEPDEKTISGKGVDIASISVLIADDEPELLASLKTVLERRKMIVLTAQSGAEALSTLSSTVVDIVVLDIKMPGMDGIEVLRRIKSDYPLVEVILLTGHPTVENALQGVKLGAIEYLMKPPDVDDLTKLIRKAYQRRQEELERSRREAINNILKKHPE